MRVFDLSMVRVRAVGPSSVGGEHYPESVVVEVFEAVGEAADFSMIRLMASVPPLETR
jgi:hypothetical protein